MKLKLALTANPAQRLALACETATPFLPSQTRVVRSCAAPNRLPFALLARQISKPVRIAPPVIGGRPMLRGNKSYLHALRAAEMVAWNASLKFPTF